MWRSVRAGRTGEALAILALLALPFVLFWRLWWPGSGGGLTYHHGDFVEQHYPMRSYVAAEYRAGRLPLWSPYTLSGEPCAANSVYSVFYPGGLWQAIFPRLPILALELETLAYLSLAGLFTYLFVREVTGCRGAGLLAGVTFSLGGYLTSYPLLQMIILQVALWLPAVLWMLERALRRRSLLHATLAGAALGVAVLGGHFQTVLYSGYLAGAYFLYRAVRLGVGWRFTLGAAGLLGLAAACVGAPQWLATLEIIPLSTRSNLTYEELSAGFAPQELWGLLRPNPDQWSPLYSGLLPLGLGLVGFVAAKRRDGLFWGAVALVGLDLSLGGRGLLYPLLYRIAPGFALFRGQERAALLVALAIAVLAGLGYRALRERWRWPGAVLPALVLLTVLDLSRANGLVLQAPPEGGWSPMTPIARYVAAHTAPGQRVSSESLLPLDGNAGLRYRYRDVTGNGPLRLAAYEEFLAQVPEIRWWQMLNVQYVVTERTLEHPAIQPVLEDAERQQRLYRLTFGERACWITHDARVVGSASQAIAMTADLEGLDPWTTAVLEEPPVPPPEPPSASEEAVLLESWQAKVAVQVHLSSPGIVVLSEVDYPGWVVRVNGERVPGLRAYGLLRAVALPAGEWRIEWAYRPWLVYVGLGLAGLAAVGLVTWALLQARRRARA